MTLVLNCAICTRAVGVVRDIAQGVVLCDRCALVVTDPDQPWATHQALKKLRFEVTPAVDAATQPGLFGPVAVSAPVAGPADTEATLMAGRLLNESGSRIGGSFGLIDRLDAIASDIRDASNDAAALDAIAPVLASLFHAADKIRTAQVTLLRSHP